MKKISEINDKNTEDKGAGFTLGRLEALPDRVGDYFFKHGLKIHPDGGIEENIISKIME